MKRLKIFLLSIVLFASFVSFEGCSWGGKVSQTSVYAGDSFLFQSEKLQVEAHDLFIEFYQWEKEYRSVLPVEVSRAADFCRLNEKKWMTSADAIHDAYVATPSGANKDKYQLALNLIRTGLGQAALYMTNLKATAPNTGLATPATLKALGITPKL